MKFRLIDLLACPNCKNTLFLYSFHEIEEKVNISSEKISSHVCQKYCGLKQLVLNGKKTQTTESELNCSKCFSIEIVEGLMICTCGSLFPIIDCVPRFIDNNLGSFPDFYKKYEEQIGNILNTFAKNHGTVSFALTKEFKSILESFSEEWDFFNYDSDKTWGWDMEERKRIFLDDLGLEGSSLKGKLLLDAGCGNGKLTAVVSNFDMEVVGLDISSSVVRANANKEKYSNSNNCFVHFIQGSLYTPPLQEKTFDLIYSSGVLHHTPDTRKTFKQVIPLVKRGGRVYIWVYGKRDIFIRTFFAHGRLLRDFISTEALLSYCRFLAPFYKVGTGILSTFKIYEFRKRNLREITLDLFDAFSPKYNHHHSRREVCSWFEGENFKNISVSGVQKHGFGVRGDRN